MKKALFVVLLSLLAFLLIFVFAITLPLPIPPYMDFQVLYHANLGLLQNVPLYDRTGQAEMIARLAGVTPEQVFVLPFPYPPWYALSTIYLALIPIDVAARIWFCLNLLMLVGSVWLLTNSRKKTNPNPNLPVFPEKNSSTGKSQIMLQRFISIFQKGSGGNIVNHLLAIFFIPSLGSLYVGQYIFPVLLGAALLIFAMLRGNIALTALAAALLVFKPHLGIPIILVVMGCLYVTRNHFSHRALKAILVGGLVLFIIGFIADPIWPVNYLHSLVDFRDVPGVVSCELCASLPIAITRYIHGHTNLHLAAPIGVILFILITATIFLLRRDLFRSPDTLIPLAILITLLADPYLLNYDYTLLLIPLYILSKSIRQPTRLWLVAVYLMPLLFLIFFDRGGNIFYSLAVIVLLAVNLYLSGKGANRTEEAIY